MAMHSQSVPWGRQATTFAWRDLRGLSRSPMVLFLAVGWPLAWYFLSLWLFLPADAAAYAIGGMAIGYALFGAFTVTVAVFAGQFARDLQDGRYRKFRSMPVAPTADVTGRFLAGVGLAVLSYASVMAVAFATGARWEPRTLAIPVVVLSLVAFCAVALVLALGLAVLVPKPEHMTTIAVVVVLIAYYVTGFNGIQPAMLAEDPWFVNYLPNSLITRLQLYYLFDADLSNTPMTPPAFPSGPEYVGLVVAYCVGLLLAAIGIVRGVAYGGDLR